MDHVWYLCLVFVMLSLLFIAAVLSSARKGLTSWLLLEMFNCIFVTFPCGILGKVWYLVVLIPDLCHHSYFKPCPHFHMTISIDVKHKHNSCQWAWIPLTGSASAVYAQIKGFSSGEGAFDCHFFVG